MKLFIYKNIEKKFKLQLMQGQYSYQQSSSSYQQTGTVMVNAGLTDRAGAKNVAKRILDTYDRGSDGVIDSIEVVPMIVDAYKSFNRVFSPSRADIESYLKVLDRNGDGKVTIQDLEDLCVKYLTSKI
jgi:Ca2+-binding EF-hand superfamily protein